MEKKNFPSGGSREGERDFVWDGGDKLEEDDMLALKRELDILDYVDGGLYTANMDEGGIVRFFDEKGSEIFETSEENVRELKKAQAERNKRRLLRSQDGKDAPETSH